jgi:hypothetical protein
MGAELLSFQQFKSLHTYVQIKVLFEKAISMDLLYSLDGCEYVLFAYNNFYIELVVNAKTTEIFQVRCFKSVKKLEPYLPYIDISQILILTGQS